MLPKNNFLLCLFLGVFVFVTTSLVPFPVFSEGGQKPNFRTVKFHAKWSDSPRAEAEIWGDGCDNLQGRLFYMGDTGTVYEGDLYCVPYLNNPFDVINQDSLAYVELWGIPGVFFDGGLRGGGFGLLAKDVSGYFVPSRSGARDYREPKSRGLSIPQNARWVYGPGSAFYYIAVNGVFQCSDQEDTFCFHADLYDVVLGEDREVRHSTRRNIDYVAFCWGCSMKESPDKIQDSIISTGTHRDLVLDGGYATPLKFYAARNIHNNVGDDFFRKKVVPAYRNLIQKDQKKGELNAQQ